MAGVSVGVLGTTPLLDLEYARGRAGRRGHERGDDRRRQDDRGAGDCRDHALRPRYAHAPSRPGDRPASRTSWPSRPRWSRGRTPRPEGGDVAALTLVLATRNEGKAREFQRLFGDGFAVLAPRRRRRPARGDRRHLRRERAAEGPGGVRRARRPDGGAGRRLRPGGRRPRTVGPGCARPATRAREPAMPRTSACCWTNSPPWARGRTSRRAVRVCAGARAAGPRTAPPVVVQAEGVLDGRGDPRSAGERGLRLRPGLPARGVGAHAGRGRRRREGRGVASGGRGRRSAPPAGVGAWEAEVAT